MTKVCRRLLTGEIDPQGQNLLPPTRESNCTSCENGSAVSGFRTRQKETWLLRFRNSVSCQPRYLFRRTFWKQPQWSTGERLRGNLSADDQSTTSPRQQSTCHADNAVFLAHWTKSHRFHLSTRRTL